MKNLKQIQILQLSLGHNKINSISNIHYIQDMINLTNLELNLENNKI